MSLKVSHGIGAWIKDFQKSDAPQFKGKSDKERRDQAIAAYLSAKRAQKEGKEETPPFDGPYKKVKSVVPGKHGEGPSTAKHLAKQGMKQAEKKPVKEGLKPGWMLKKDPELAKKLKAKIDLAKKRQATYGDKSAGKSVGEATTFEVDIEGLPKMYIKDKSPGAVKAKLRGIVKQPSMIQGVDRVTDAEMKKTYRDKAQGRDEVDEAVKPRPTDSALYKTLGPTRHYNQGVEALKKAHGFTAAQAKGHINRLMTQIAKADKTQKESVKEVSGAMAQRYHDKAAKTPLPANKKTPEKALKRFAGMMKAQDRIHRDELKRIGGQK